jgi:hypothetical protein
MALLFDVHFFYEAEVESSASEMKSISHAPMNNHCTIDTRRVLCAVMRVVECRTPRVCLELVREGAAGWERALHC